MTCGKYEESMPAGNNKDWCPGCTQDLAMSLSPEMMQWPVATETQVYSNTSMHNSSGVLVHEALRNPGLTLFLEAKPQIMKDGKMFYTSSSNAAGKD